MAPDSDEENEAPEGESQAAESAKRKLGRKGVTNALRVWRFDASFVPCLAPPEEGDGSVPMEGASEAEGGVLEGGLLGGEGLQEDTMDGVEEEGSIHQAEPDQTVEPDVGS